MRLYGDRHANIRGGALVEFAIVCMVLFTLVFGVIEIGYLMDDQYQLNEAASQTARGLSFGDSIEVAMHNGTATTNLKLTSSNYTLLGYTPASGSTTAPPTPPSTANGWYTITDVTTGTAPNNANAGDYVAAVVTYAHPLLTGFILGKGTYTITSTCVDVEQD
jgi:Flp pilus assembly protein TadG